MTKVKAFTGLQKELQSLGKTWEFRRKQEASITKYNGSFSSGIGESLENLEQEKGHQESPMRRSTAVSLDSDKETISVSES